MGEHPIPDEALNTHIAILGKTGSGKTYSARGLVERLLKMGRHVVIVDPTGAWYGLRTGFDIPIFGGRKGDIEINDTAGEAVAAVIAEQRTSAIVDLSLMSGGAQRRFMRGFAHRLRSKEPGALYLVIDEADEFLPQNLQPDMANLFGDLKWMVRRGRLNGFRVMMITQRPAEIAKAVLTQIETLVAHRLTAPQDRKAIEEWVKGHHDANEAREVLTTLASLEKGEAWVWCPDINLLTRARMPQIETFDSGRTPEPGETLIDPPALESLDLSAIKAALESKEPESQKQSVGKSDNIRITDLERQVSELGGQFKAMTAERDEWRAKSYEYERQISAIREIVAGNELHKPDTPGAFVGNGGKVMEGEAVRAPNPIRPLARGPGPNAKDGPLGGVAAALPSGGPSAPSDLAPRHKRILDAIAWCCEYLRRASVERNIVAWIADTSPKSSSYANDLGALRTRGLIDYPSSGTLALTIEGGAIAYCPNVPGSRDELWRKIAAKLPPRQVRIVEALFDVEALFRADLAEKAEVSASSSSFANDLGHLRSLGLIDYPSSGAVALGRVWQ